MYVELLEQLMKHRIYVVLRKRILLQVITLKLRFLLRVNDKIFSKLFEYSLVLIRKNSNYFKVILRKKAPLRYDSFFFSSHVFGG